MAKLKEKDKQIVRVKDVVNELKLNPTDVVFLYKYMSREYNNHCLVSELTAEQLKQTVLTVNKGYGGSQHKYSAWQIIIH